MNGFTIVIWPSSSVGPNKLLKPNPSIYLRGLFLTIQCWDLLRARVCCSFLPDSAHELIPASWLFDCQFLLTGVVHIFSDPRNARQSLLPNRTIYTFALFFEKNFLFEKKETRSIRGI